MAPTLSGSTSDLEESTAHRMAGPDVGDANLDSDSDSSGTGERATAGRDTVVEGGADIDTDQIFHASQVEGRDASALASPSKQPHPRSDQQR